MVEEIRKLTISHFSNEKLTNGDSLKIKKFLQYLGAYCVEMKLNEQDVLLNDEHYEKVYRLYENVMLK